MTVAPGSMPDARRVHRVVAELDGRGEIDAHAALCLRHAIDAAHAGPATTILVDLRDLTAITPMGVALFRAHDADCRSHGETLGLLINGEERHRHIADAFERGGLADTLHFTGRPLPPAGACRLRLIEPASSVRRGRLTRAARRVAPRRQRRARAI
jgi:anti-anti-sigma factor